MGLLDLAVHHLEGVPLASHATKDSRAVKAKVQSLGKLAGGVTEESDLGISVSHDDLRERETSGHASRDFVYSRQSAWRGQAARSTPSYCINSSASHLFRPNCDI